MNLDSVKVTVTFTRLTYFKPSYNALDSYIQQSFYLARDSR